MIFGKSVWLWVAAWLGSSLAAMVLGQIPGIGPVFVFLFGLVYLVTTVVLLFYVLWKFLRVAVPFGLAAAFDGGGTLRNR